MLEQKGYKRLAVGEQPELGENEYLEPVYTETDTTVEKHWVIKQFEEEEIEDTIEENTSE